MKTNLKGLSLVGLQDFMASHGHEKFRAKQLFKWIYGRGLNTFDEMTNLSKPLREELSHISYIGSLQLLSEQASQKDGAVKFLFGLEDGQRIESVLMFDRERVTLCISTQVGCALDCKFCATGMLGLTRQLSTGEIVDQLLSVQRITNSKVTNLVCMGMGEPFHNYQNLMEACDILSDESGPSLARRRIVVSTSGLVSRIYQFADEQRKFKLAISLNASDDATRSEIMPLNRKWPIARLLEAARYYCEKSGERVTFEYVLMDGINDSKLDAQRLFALASSVNCKLNLIPYNATMGRFRRPSEARIGQFFEALQGLWLPVTIRWSKGDDIDAGCGQLAAKASESALSSD
jgi:23S rRNA (adenine2503-C2)-methyltransferase